MCCFGNLTPFWRTIVEQEQFKGNYLRLTTEAKDGKVFERAYVRDGVCVIPIADDGKICMIREKNWHDDHFCTKLVAGYVDDGEEHLHTAKRELKEEIGMTADSWELYIKSKMNGVVVKHQYYYIARGLHEGVAQLEPGELIEGYNYFDPHDVLTSAMRGEYGTTSTAFVLLKLATELCAGSQTRPLI